MKTFPTLYKRTSKGTSQQWDIKAVEDLDGHPAIVTVYGQVGGAMLEAAVAVRQGKNLGKANATTPYQQACLEAEAKWRKQKDKGYVEVLDAEVMGAAVERKPMLAQDYAKHRDKVVFPCYVQPKLDGMRCLAHRGQGGVTLMSRGNKPITTMGHIAEALEGLMEVGETWDGELYIHGETFQNLVSWIKKERPESRRVQYHVYDKIDADDFVLRLRSLETRLDWSNPEGVVRLVPTFVSGSHGDVTTQHNALVANGYEGLMVRHNGCHYKEGYRSRDLLKVKMFHEGEYRIVGAREGKGKMEGCAVFELETADGTRFECLPEGDVLTRKGYWDRREQLIGKMLTVRYFEMTSSENPVPRFPIGRAVRDYE